MERMTFMGRILQSWKRDRVKNPPFLQQPAPLESPRRQHNITRRTFLPQATTDILFDQNCLRVLQMIIGDKPEVPTPVESIPMGSMESPIADVEAVRTAAQSVGKILADRTYAIVGGAACALLGSPRTTTDVDIVVPRGSTKEIRQLFRSTEGFVVENGTLHTYFTSDPRVDIEILTPPSLFREEFDVSTPVVTVGSAKVLKPALILNSKCGSVLNRGEEKKLSDAHDIKFLLKWSYDHGEIPTKLECPRITPEFVEWYVENFGGEEHWQNIGYDGTALMD